jgi:hypothetical protein
MTQLNITDSIGEGYRTVWLERQYLLRLAAAPLLIKFICWNLIVSLDWETNIIRQALIMLPSLFADGWMAAHLVRYVFFDQKWPFRPTGQKDNDIMNLQNRASGIMAGAVSYVLIQFLVMGLMALSYEHLQKLQEIEAAVTANSSNIVSGNETKSTAPPPNIPPAAFALFAMITVSIIWGFRYTFAYIPAAANLSIRKFYKGIKGLQSSFYLIAIWMICFFPAFTLLQMIIENLISGFPDSTSFDSLPIMLRLFIDALRIIADILILSLTTLSLSAAIKRLYYGSPPNKKTT